jgi:hypothetical protein
MAFVENRMAPPMAIVRPPSAAGRVVGATYVDCGFAHPTIVERIGIPG